MDTKQIIYHANGVAVNLWKRIAASKTFWIIAAFVLTAADRWNKHEITTSDFFQIVQIGVIGILIRAAMAKSELAANAANPDIPTIGATEKTAKIPTAVTGVATCILAAGALLTITACTAPVCPVLS